MKPERTPKRKVLVVDDDEGMIELLCKVLSDLPVDIAKDGKEAWRKLNEDDYDVLIADFNLPGIHGRDLLRMMLDEGIDVPTVIMSGLPLPEETVKMLNGSRCAVVLKPFSIEKIREKVLGFL